MRNFIIGYGSLISKKSLKRTLPQVTYTEPVYVKNYLRSWSAIIKEASVFTTTYLGVEKCVDSKINGVIFEVEESLLSTLDRREFLYKREKVSLDEIEFFTDFLKINSKDNIWIYITKSPKKPTSKFPIIQSYVDTCLEGCIEIEENFFIEEFAIDFINSTKQWSNYWVNDRIFPRAPHIHRPDSYLIDKLLIENIPEYFSNITIE
jgi:hypothetical protein